MKPSIRYRILQLSSLLFLLISCQRFFMPVQNKASTASEKGAYISGNQPDKYFILRQGKEAYAMKQITVNKDNNTLTCVLAPVAPEHRLYTNAKNERYVYKSEQQPGNRKETAPVLKEVHLYLKDGFPLTLNTPVTIPLDNISMIEVLEHDRSRTTSSYVLGGIGIGVGAIVLAGVIVALTKSSCPYVGVYDGNTYHLQGELFGGAVNRQLERTDYVPLAAPLINEQYRLRISNQLKERQFTNSAVLQIVEHPVHVTPYIDNVGNLYTINNPVVPAQAWLQQSDMRKELAAPDGKICNFNDTSLANGLNRLRLLFPVSQSSKNAKLILRLKNSYWLDYLYGEFARRFGSEYVKWQQRQQRRPAAEMIQWTKDQYIPLQVALKTTQGIRTIATIHTTGPLLNRDMIVPVDLGQIEGNTAEIILTCGFMFWELDYAALDQSPDVYKLVGTLQPAAATDETGKDIRQALLQNDDRYLSQPNAGNTAELVYEWKQQPKQGYAYSVFLVTRGYYEPIREFTGKPDIAFLKSFRQPAAMSAFSMRNWNAFIKESSIAGTQNK